MTEPNEYICSDGPHREMARELLELRETAVRECESLRGAVADYREAFQVLKRERDEAVKEMRAEAERADRKDKLISELQQRLSFAEKQRDNAISDRRAITSASGERAAELKRAREQAVRELDEARTKIVALKRERDDANAYCGVLIEERYDWFYKHHMVTANASWLIAEARWQRDEWEVEARHWRKEDDEPSQPKVVTLCGSMRFFDAMLQVAAEETAKGHIVIAPFCVVAPGEQDTEQKKMLDELHRRKIDMSDHIIVVTDETGYVGDSTRAEMVYATKQGKFWDYTEHVREVGGAA